MRRRARRSLLFLALACAVLVVLACAPLAARAQPLAVGCDRCHAELELLRQQVSSLEAARALLVPESALAGSAHEGMTCASCHVGFTGFPHAAQPPPVRRCDGCHQDVVQVWRSSVHGADSAASCEACHGVHDVAETDAPEERSPATALDGRCASCHAFAAFAAGDAHADSVACVACHAGHDTHRVDDPRASVAARNQAVTCGACHEEAASDWTGDAHGSAAARAVDRESDVAMPADGHQTDAPTCTACHGAHPVRPAEGGRFESEMTATCAACHVEYGDSYSGTYHGKATAAGSEIAATCDRCHGAHRILPADDPRSAIADATVVETCGACHEHARPAFVEYDAHPDPMDRSRNAPLFYSFVFMNVLLFGTLAVFGLHTALWWVRSTIDRARARQTGGVP